MKQIFTLSMISLMLMSCGGEFSYKRGATPRDLASAKSTCKGQGLEKQEDIAQCLEKNGWKVSQLDDLDLFAVIKPTDNRATENNADTQESAFVMVKKEEVVADVASEEKPTKQKVVSDTKLAVTPADAANTKLPKTTSQAPKSTAKQQSAKDPLKIYKVSSWWKFGSSAAMLETQTTECVATLGEAHKPNYATQEVTRGLVVCLYKKGWKALKAK